jgi:hypothetical protein
MRLYNRRARQLEKPMAYESDWNKDEQEKKDEGKGTASTAAAGMGCLSVATLPFSFILLVVVFFLALWLLRQCAG